MYTEYDADRNDRKRVIDLGNNKIILKQTDPFGLVHINFERGQMPDELKGSFTSFDYAKRAIEIYLNKKKRGRVVTEELPEEA